VDGCKFPGLKSGVMMWAVPYGTITEILCISVSCPVENGVKDAIYRVSAGIIKLQLGQGSKRKRV